MSELRSAPWRVRALALVLLGVLAVALGEIGARALPRPSRALPPELERVRPLNAAGFHDVEHPVAKPPGTFRVLCLGDSVTFARGIPLDESYCRRLQGLLAPATAAGAGGVRVETISFAREGLSTAHEVRMLEHLDGLALAPDVLVLAYVLNDPEDETRPVELDRAREPTVRRSPPAWLSPLTSVSRLAELVFERIENTRRYHAEVRYVRMLHRPSYRGWPLCREAFQRLGELSRGSGVHVLVAIFPMLDFPLDGRYPFRRVHERVTETARGAGLEVLDLLPTFAPRAGPQLLLAPGIDSHPSAAAHGLAADSIAAEIRRLGWAPAASTPQGVRSAVVASRHAS